jgi:hypothetical protein
MDQEYYLKPRPRLGEAGSEAAMRKMSATGSSSPTSEELYQILSPQEMKLI